MLVSPWIRRVLFAVALVALPLPYQVVDSGRVPAAWLGTVAGMVAASAVLEGGGISTIMARWFALQAGVAILLAYAAARLVSAIIRRRVAPARQWRTAGFVAAGALAAACFPIFASTAVRGGVPLNLFAIFAAGR